MQTDQTEAPRQNPSPWSTAQTPRAEPEFAGEVSATSLRRILQHCKTVAVVGMSDQWHRPSHFVGQYLKDHGYRVVPVNPRCTEILGLPCYASLTDIPFPVDMVDVFRRSADVLPIAKQAVAIGARCLWQQIGVINTEADALVREAGLDSVMDRCVKIEHARLFGGLHWFGVNTKVISAQRLRGATP